VAEQPVPVAAAAARPRVLVAGVVMRRRKPMLDKAAAVLAAGGSAVLVAADGGPPAHVPDGVEVIDLSWFEARVPGRLVASRPWKAIRGWLMWQALRRSLDAVRVDELDMVLLVDIQSWPVAWQLNRRNPRVVIGWDVPDELFTQHGRMPPPPPASLPDPTAATS